MNERKGKLSSARGFTILEMMVTCLIMSLVVGIVAQTLALAIRQFRARSADSEAEMLCNDLCVSVRDQLSFVTKLEGDLSKNPTFYSTASSLSAYPCTIVADAGDVAGSGIEEGALALCYRVKNGDYYHRLGATSHQGFQWVSLREKIEYRYENEVFKVKVTVSDDKHVIGDHVKEFVVLPVLREIATS